MQTQSMEAVARSLAGVLPPNAIAQLSDALGNCARTLAHRGNLNVQPTKPGNKTGSYGPGTWNPDDYTDILPDGGYDPTWNNYNYGGNGFYFPTNQEFNINQFHGGPTSYFGGNTYTDAMTTQNVTTNNINTTTINGFGIPGELGPTGPAGAVGQNGRDGQNGPGINGGIINITVNKGRRYRIQQVGGGLRSAVASVKFNPDNCSIETTRVTINETEYDLVEF